MRGREGERCEGGRVRGREDERVRGEREGGKEGGREGGRGWYTWEKFLCWIKCITSSYCF